MPWGPRGKAGTGFFQGLNATPCYAFQNASRVAILTGIIVTTFVLTQPRGESIYGEVSADHHPGTGLLEGRYDSNSGGPPLARHLAEDMPVWEQIIRSVAVAVLVFFSGAFAGLLLGLMGPEKNQLRILKEAGSPDEKEYSQKIWDIRKHSNLLLCTLLIGNVAVNSLISIISAGLTTGTIGFIISTALISIFGEVVPTIFCSRYALLLGAKSVPMMKVAMVIFYPVAKPMALIIDWTFGEEIGRFYSKEEFTQLIASHKDVFSKDQRRIMQGALTFGDATAGDVMTPRDKIYSLSSTNRLDFDTMSEIFRRGFSRIPVWNAEGTWMIGLLYAKDLVLVSPEEELPVMSVISLFHREVLPIVDAEDSLGEVLYRMHSEKVHFAAVRTIDDSVADRDPIYVLSGCVTMEAIIEQILQMEVEDEYDHPSDESVVSARKEEVAEMHRMNLLSLAGMTEELSESMARAIAYTLLETVPVFREEVLPGRFPSVDLLTGLLVQTSRTLYLAKPEGSKPNQTPLHSAESTEVPANIVEANKIWESGGVVVESGQSLSGAIIILEGTLEVTSGQDEMVYSRKRFECVAQRALVQEDYRADFRLTMQSQYATILMLDRKEYLEALEHGHVTNRQMQSNKRKGSKKAARGDTAGKERERKPKVPTPASSVNSETKEVPSTTGTVVHADPDINNRQQDSERKGLLDS
eukprot:gb/GECG01012330.1/.p1 GENE.gb/GECG01012330.1/~~gb/GECG01012330.1/.p1  ORF type:complete len:696 (+),score=84.23 gb/GECG01012330.1/:1-2088(+)